jgi:DNA repair protein RAD16
LKTTTLPTKDKGKGKTPARRPSPAVEESELGLEYDEDPLLEESDDSGSEFVASDVDKAEVAPEDDDSETEALMLDAAIRMSFETNRNGVASSSATQLVSPDPAAVLRATAAERRLNRANKNVDVDDYPMGDNGAYSSSDDESDVPLSKKKGKGVAKNAKKGVTVHDTSKTKHMTLAQLRKAKREERRKFNSARKELKTEEKALRIELGRPLTHVSLSEVFSRELSLNCHTGRKINYRIT